MRVKTKMISALSLIFVIGMMGCTKSKPTPKADSSKNPPTQPTPVNQQPVNPGDPGTGTPSNSNGGGATSGAGNTTTGTGTTTSTGNNPPVAIKPPTAPGKPLATVEMLRLYCKACHAVGGPSMRFIVSDNDQEVIQFILNNTSPSGTKWIDGMITALTWPSNNPPSKDDTSLMPLGAKKFQIAKKNQSSTLTEREVLLEKLKKHRADGK